MYKAAHTSIAEAGGPSGMIAEEVVEFIGEGLEKSAVAIGEGRREVQRYVCTEELSREVPVGKEITSSPQERKRLLCDLSREDGGPEKILLLISHVETNETLRPHDPETRSADVQQLQRDFTKAFQAVSSARQRCPRLHKSSSSSTVLVDPCTISHSFIYEGNGKACKSQTSWSVEQGVNGEAAAAGDKSGSSDEAGNIDGGPVICSSRTIEFKDLALDSALLDSLFLLGFRIPSPVQCAVVPRALEGKNLIVQAKSGTGKTLAFALYVLHALTHRFKRRLAELTKSLDTARPRTSSQPVSSAGSAEGKGQHACPVGHLENEELLHEPVSSTDARICPSVAADAYCIAMTLVVTPTRELTIQVANEFSRLGWFLQQPRLRHACFFGGRPLSVCHRLLTQQPHVLISTPGRLLSLLRSDATRKAVAAWPCLCRRATGRHRTGSVPCDSTCDSTRNSEARVRGVVTIRKRGLDGSPTQLVKDDNAGKSSRADGCAFTTGYGEKLTFSRHLRERLCIMVLDEADMLLDHYFRRQIRKLLSATLHPRLQLLAVSATFLPPCIAFLEDLCHSLDAQMQHDNCQSTTGLVDLPRSHTQSRGRERGQRGGQEGTADREAAASLQASAAVATFIRDHALAANAAVSRNAATEAYLRNVCTQHLEAKRDPLCEGEEDPLERSSIFGKISEREAVVSRGPEGCQDGESVECPEVVDNTSMRRVSRQSSQQLRPAASVPRVFEKVMLCSSLIIHDSQSCEVKHEGVVQRSTEWVAQVCPRIAADSSVKEAFATDVSPGVFETSLDRREEGTSHCRPAEKKKALKDERHSVDCLEHQHGYKTDASRGTADVSVISTWVESKPDTAYVRKNSQARNTVEDEHISCTDVSGKVLNESVSAREDLPYKKALDDVPMVDAIPATFKSADGIHSTENTSEEEAALKQTFLSSGVADSQLGRQESAEQGEVISLEKDIQRPTVITTSPSEDVSNQGGEAPSGCKVLTRTKHKTESPSLAGIRYVIMTVAEEPSLMRQLGAKVRALQRIFASLTFRQAMVFCNHAEAGAQVAACLIQLGVPTLYTSSRLTQERRVRNLLALKRIECRVFVCSDVMSRGIDAAAVDLVVNLDIPRDKEIFLHRSGRAGRFGGSGVCVSIASEGEEPFFQYFVTALNLQVFPNLESLSRLQGIQTSQQNSVEAMPCEGVAAVQEECALYPHGHDLMGLQGNTGSEGEKNTAAASWQSAGSSNKRLTEEQNLDQSEGRNVVLSCGPDNSSSATEVRTDVGFLAPASQPLMTIRQCYTKDVPEEEGSQISALHRTGSEEGNSPFASGTSVLDTCDSEHRTETSFGTRAAIVQASLLIEARGERENERARGERENERARGYQPVPSTPKMSLAGCLQHPGEVDGFDLAGSTSSKKTERTQQQRGFTTVLPEGVHEAGSIDVKMSVEYKSRTKAATSSLPTDLYPHSNRMISEPSRLHPDENVCRFVSESMECHTSRCNGNSLLQRGQNVYQWRRHGDSLFLGETSVLALLAIAALSSHDGLFCDNWACPSALLFSSEDAWDAADADLEGRAFALRANSLQSSMRTTGSVRRRSSDAAMFDLGGIVRESMACRKVMRTPFSGCAIAVDEQHTQVKLKKDWKTKRIPRCRTDPRHDHTRLARCNPAAAVGSALLSLKRTHALLWKSA